MRDQYHLNLQESVTITNKTYSLARVLQDEMMIEKQLLINQHDKTMEMLSI